MLPFAFKDGLEAKRVLAKGSKRLKEGLLWLESGNPELGAEQRRPLVRKVRVLGLLLHPWSTLKELGIVMLARVAMEERIGESRIGFLKRASRCCKGQQGFKARG